MEEDLSSSDWEVYNDAFKNHVFKASRIGVRSQARLPELQYT
jgi:hypothetical protein